MPCCPSEGANGLPELPVCGPGASSRSVSSSSVKSSGRYATHTSAHRRRPMFGGDGGLTEVELQRKPPGKYVCGFVGLEIEQI